MEAETDFFVLGANILGVDSDLTFKFCKFLNGFNSFQSRL